MRRWPSSVRIAACALLVLVAVHSAVWWWASRRVRDGFAAWLQGERAAGLAVTAGAPSLAGWPFAAGVHVPGLALDGPGWRWSAQSASLTIRPWAPRHLRVQPSGRQSFAVGGAAFGLQARSTLLTLALPAGDAPILDVAAPVIDTPFGQARADLVTASMTSDGGTRADLDVTGLSLPPGAPYLLGPDVAELAVGLAAPGPLPVLRAADLAAWRDAGGTVRLDALHLRWGQLTLDAAGTAGLDRTLQPLADVRIRLSGQDTALDGSVAQGLLQARTAAGIRAVLGLLSAARADGQPGAIPASLHDGVVAVAGFPVVRLPPVRWP